MEENSKLNSEEKRIKKDIERDALIKFNQQIKDKVFHYAFNNKHNLADFCNEHYLLKKTIKADEIEIIKSGSMFIKTFMADVNFQVDDLLLCNLEAMATLEFGDIGRIGLYVWSNIINYYLYLNNVLHQPKKKIPIPKIACFVLYTGTKKVKDRYSLREDFFNGNPEAPDVIFYVLRPDHSIVGSIANQYMRFAQYQTEFLKSHGPEHWFSRKEIMAFIDKMISKGILVEILKEHRNEVVDMIEALNNFSTYLDEELKKSKDIGRKEGEAIGEARGRSEGETIGEERIIKKLFKNGMNLSEIARSLSMSKDKIQKILSNSN